MNEVQSLSSEQLQSKVISFLRFPLIVGVVLIHTQISEINGIKGDMSAPHPFGGIYPLYESVLYLFAQILARVAVPLFFFFSGFLFFYKLEGFTKGIYWNKIKKRVRTLFVPYIFWNIMFVLFYNVSGKLFSGATKSFIGEGFSMGDWVMIFWNYNDAGMPVSYQFWFIRDLIVVVLFSPVIYWLTKRLGCFFSLFLGILWLLGWWFDIVGFSISAFFFFTLGAYFSIVKKNFVELVKAYVLPLGVLYTIFVAITFCTREFEWVGYAKQISIILGVAFVIALSAVYISKGEWKVNKFLSESSFFIYAYHIIALPIIIRVLRLIIPFNSDLLVAFLYFLWAGIAVAVGLIIYWGLKRWLPRITAIITGGR